MNNRAPLNALNTFVAVATRLSFSAGAKALHVTPAAVSSQIRALEEQLGTALFIRQGRKVSLTDAGKSLLPGVQSGLTQINESVRALSLGREEGVLNVSMLASFLENWLTPRLHEFYERYPQIDLRINADMSLVDFQQTDFHAGIRFGKGDYKGLMTTKLLDDWILPVCSPELLERYGPLESVDELHRYPQLHSSDEPWDGWLQELGGSPDNKRGPMFNDSVSTAAAAKQGLGVGLTRWSLVAADLEAGRLVRPLQIVTKSAFAYYFVAPARYNDLPKVRDFRDWLEDCCRRFDAPIVQASQ